MTWSLQWGEHVKAFQEMARKTGNVPRPLQNRPKLLNLDLPYYGAFQSCNASRPAGASGAAAIPISEITAYCQLVGIASREERVKYLNLIQELDSLCLEHWAKEAKKTQ